MLTAVSAALADVVVAPDTAAVSAQAAVVLALMLQIADLSGNFLIQNQRPEAARKFHNELKDSLNFKKIIFESIYIHKINQ